VIVLDTHAWIWWLSEPDRLSSAAQRAIDRADRVGVSPISCWELATKVSRGKLTLDRPLTLWMRQALAHPRSTVVTLTPEVAVLAGELAHGEIHGDPADRLIAATALVHQTVLVTKDERLRDFERLRTVW
jgi:PIN domain nuclease of toxin-antitoxin system